jgi:hypothetical protein
MTYCPLLKDNCQENNCVMFKDARCVLVDFLAGHGSSEYAKAPSECVQDENPCVNKEVLDWLSSINAKDLGEQILEFVKNEYPINEEIDESLLYELFWASKGITECDVSPELRAKMRKAESVLKVECIRSRIKTKIELSNLNRLAESSPSSWNNKKTVEAGTDELQAPKWLKEHSAEEIGQELVDFVEKEYPTDNNANPILLCQLFWASKGLCEYDLPAEFRLKIHQAENILRVKSIKSQIEKGRMPIERRDIPEGLPEWLLKDTPEQISDRISDFIKRSFQKQENVDYGFMLNDMGLIDLFWKINGVNLLSLPSEVLSKKEKAEGLFKKEQIIAQMRKAEENIKKEETEKLKPENEIILEQTAEELADEAVKFIKKEYTNMALKDVLSDFYQLFWQYRKNKVGEKSLESDETQQKFEKALILARSLINEEKNNLREQREIA